MLDYKVTIIKIMWFWYKNVFLNDIEKIFQKIYIIIFYMIKSKILNQQERSEYLVRDVVKIDYFGEKNIIFIIYCMLKYILNRLKS